MFGKIARFIRGGGDTPHVLQHPMLTRAAVAVGYGIDELPDFERRLLPAIESALNYFDSQISIIPGPVEISEATAGNSPFFPGGDELGHALGRSLATKEALPDLIGNGHQDIYALLGMRTKPGASTGSAFSDHTLHSLASSPEETRDALRLAAFDRVLRSFIEHTEKLRRKDHLLKLEWDWNLQHDIVNTPEPENDASPEFVYASQELTPDKLVHGLTVWLSHPERVFRLEPAALALPLAEAGSPLELPLLHCSDRRQWLVSLICFPTADGSRALERESHTHRYIFV